jgi:RND family efflux transporter MFP subunit
MLSLRIDARSLSPIPTRKLVNLLLLHRLFTAVILTILFTVGCADQAESQREGKTERPVSTVRGEIFQVEPKIWPTRVRVQGSLVADEVASIGTKVAGRVTQVHVDLGDSIETGSPMVTIDDSQFKLLVSQAEAQLQQGRSAVGLREGDPLEKLNPDNAAPVREARAIWEEAEQAVRRIRRLAEQNAISETDVEVAEAAERVAAARLTSAQNGVREKLALIAAQMSQLGLAKQNLVDTVVVAPFKGKIQNRDVAVGTYVQPGQTLFTLTRLSPIRFRAAVPERYTHQLKPGQEVRLNIDLSQQEFVVKIARISPALDPLSRSLTFEALIDNADESLRSGLFAEGVVVLDPEAKAIVVPTSCLVRFAGVDKVWKIENETLREQVVRLGRLEEKACEILDGLKLGDMVLVEGNDGRTGRFEKKALQ